MSILKKTKIVYVRTFAVLNGKDTLKLNIVDTITQHLFFESANNAAFFRSLTKEPWDKLYDLLRDSTFYFCAEKGTHVVSRSV